MAVADYFGEWTFNDDGSISVEPDMEWVVPSKTIQAENKSKSARTGSSTQKYQPRMCSKCGKYWTNFCGVENYSRVIKKEYLRSDIFGGLPMEKETCWKCDDV